MSKTISFSNGKAKLEKKKEISEMRAMVDRMREIEENEPDYDATANLQAAIAEVDPELASLIEDSATVSVQAEMGRLRCCGVEIEGTDFEKLRDRKAITKEKKVNNRLFQKFHKL